VAVLHVQGPAKTPVGCTMWMSPQAVRNRDRAYKDMIPYGPICDIWSAAVTLYYLLYTKWPFSDKQILEWTQPGSKVEDDKVKYPESEILLLLLLFLQLLLPVTCARCLGRMRVRQRALLQEGTGQEDTQVPGVSAQAAGHISKCSRPHQQVPVAHA
jgi:serine/threonine protein kinase